MVRRSLPGVLTVILSVGLWSACGGDDGGGGGGTEPEDPRLTSVTVTPANGQLAAIGATTQLTAAPKDQDGNAFGGAQVTWSSNAEGVATVDANGVVTAVDNGTATITAQASHASGNASAQAQIVVDQQAAQVVVTAPQDTLTTGQNMQLAASATDSNQNPVDDATFTWESSDESVATVDNTGLVTAVGKGEVTLSATADGTEGTAPLTVIVGDVTFSADASIEGTLEAKSLTIEAGVTVTATADAAIDASGAVTIDGTLTGDCVDLDVTGGAGMTVTGTIANDCSGAATGPDLDIVAAGALVMTGATVQSSGAINIANDGTASAVAPGGAARATEDRPCTFEAVLLVKLPNQAGPGLPGDNIGIRCVNDALFVGGNQIQAQDGGDGTGDTAGNPTATGGAGGSGGNVGIEVLDGDAVFQNNTIGGAQGTSLVSGFGGSGGDATAQGTDAEPNATATGGAGSAGGSVLVQVLNGSITFEGLGALRVDIGDGGDGGDAMASGWDGDDPSEDGGSATATGGSGGDSGFPQILAQGGPPADLTNVIQTGANGGLGGDATAHGGIGADGDATSPPGGEGGAMIANGGAGGAALEGPPLVAGLPGAVGPYLAPLGDSGDGGDADFDFGWGGDGADMCWTAAGGDGGRGGDGTGAGGPRGGDDASDGTETVADGTGDGGNGGDGVGPGAGGNGGTPDIPEGNGQPWPDAFRDGLPGMGCMKVLQVEIVVLEDPGGHEPFIQMVNTVTELKITLLGDGAIEISGNGNFITVSGSINESGQVQATGIGVAAGFSGTLAVFQGTVQIDAETGMPVSIEGTYEVGGTGNLPGGQATLYGAAPPSG